jgi:hypothetical protein
VKVVLLGICGSFGASSKRLVASLSKVSEFNLLVKFIPIDGSEVAASTEEFLIQQILESNHYDTMKIEILNRFTPDRREYIEWNLWDGPEDIDHAHGYASDLVQAFSKIFEWRERIAADYADEILADIETVENFIQNNETD